MTFLITILIFLGLLIVIMAMFGEQISEIIELLKRHKNLIQSILAAVLILYIVYQMQK